MHKALDSECASDVQRGMVHLADYMARRGLKDKEVADGIGCSRPTVSRIRRRLVRPDWQTIEKIREFTNGQSTADDYTTLEIQQ